MVVFIERREVGGGRRLQQPEHTERGGKEGLPPSLISPSRPVFFPFLLFSKSGADLLSEPNCLSIENLFCSKEKGEEKGSDPGRDGTTLSNVFLLLEIFFGLLLWAESAGPMSGRRKKQSTLSSACYPPPSRAAKKSIFRYD